MKFPVEAGNVYYGKFYGRQGTGFAGGDVGFRVVWLNAAGGVISSSPIAAPIVGGAYAMYTGTVTAPALAVEGQVQLYSLAQTAGVVLIDDLFLAEMNAGDLMVDGSIRGNHLSVTTAIITDTIQIANAIITSAHVLGTLSASKLDIATRNVTFTGLQFEHDLPAANRCAWTAGTVRYIGDAGGIQALAIAAGSTAIWTTGVLYIYWTQGGTILNSTTVQATAFASGNFVVGTYMGANRINADFGNTVIDGPNIKTGSVTAAQGIFASAAVQTLDIAGQAVTVAQNGFSDVNTQLDATLRSLASVTLTRASGFQTEIIWSLIFYFEGIRSPIGNRTHTIWEFTLQRKIGAGAWTTISLAYAMCLATNPVADDMSPVTAAFVDTDTTAGSTTYRVLGQQTNAGNFVQYMDTATIIARQFKR